MSLTLKTLYLRCPGINNFAKLQRIHIQYRYPIHKCHFLTQVTKPQFPTEGRPKANDHRECFAPLVELRPPRKMMPELSRTRWWSQTWNLRIHIFIIFSWRVPWDSIFKWLMSNRPNSDMKLRWRRDLTYIQINNFAKLQRIHIQYRYPIHKCHFQTQVTKSQCWASGRRVRPEGVRSTLLNKKKPRGREAQEFHSRSRF